MARDGVKHFTSAPYHPATNGQAERMVAETKCTLGKLRERTLLCRISRFLYKQHSTITTSGKTPAELMFGRHCATVLDRMHSHLPSEPLQDSSRTADNVIHFHKYQLVYMPNFSAEPRWVPAVVVQSTGSRSYLLKTSDGSVHRRHVDYIRQCFLKKGEGQEESSVDVTSVGSDFRFPGNPPSSTDHPSFSEHGQVSDPGMESPAASAESVVSASVPPMSSEDGSPTHPVPLWRPRRQRRPPERFGFHGCYCCSRGESCGIVAPPGKLYRVC